MLFRSDLSHLPQLTLTGTASAQIEPLGWNPTLKALWPNERTLVWSVSQRLWPMMYDGVVLKAAPIIGNTSPVTPGMAIYPWWGGSSDSRLLAFDVNNPSSPVFLGQTKFAAGAWNVGPLFADNNVIFASHSASWNMRFDTFAWATKANGPATPTLVQGQTLYAVDLSNPQTNATGVQTVVQGWMLDAIDFSNPAAPVVRDPISIPNQLVGVSNSGTLLYTEGIEAQGASGNVPFLDACAYDTVSSFLVDSVQLSGWSNSVVVSGSTIFVGHASGTNGITGAIDAWKLGASGQFARLGSAAVAQAPSKMRTFGSLLAASVGSTTKLFDASNPVALKLLNSTESNAFSYLSLDCADGDVSRGLWFPVNDYGVEFLDANP